MLKSSIETSERVIWDPAGNLAPIPPAKERPIMDVAAIIVNRDQPGLTDDLVERLARECTLKTDIYVIELGSTGKRSKYCSYYYADSDYRGKCYGHNVGLRIAAHESSYKYYWVMMNDLVYPPNLDCSRTLYDLMEKHRRLAVLSPTEPEAGYAGCKPRDKSDFHLVSTCDYLSLFMRASAVHNCGFLNPAFKYCWGAIHELAYKIYKAGHAIAYCDTVTMKHLGGTTYGKVKGLVSREQYKQNAALFAARYFSSTYGKFWDQKFSAVLPSDVLNFFPQHRVLWEKYLTPEERALCH